MLSELDNDKPYQLAKSSLAIGKVPEPLTASQWADNHFYLSSESSNTSGKWKTIPIQVAILNAMGNDAIEKVDFFKPTRFGGTKMDVAAMFYLIEHKRRNICFYQPSKGDSDEFVKSEIQPSLRDCPLVEDLMIDKSESNSYNTLSYKAFRGCVAYFKGGHSPSSYERMTLDAVILDELDLFNTDVSKRGNPTTLSYARVRNSLFKKQIQTSKPTLEGFSLIQKSSMAANDILDYKVKCPECETHTTIEWGGHDVQYGFKWSENDPSTVKHYCKECGSAWDNSCLHEVSKGGYWEGENGYKTYDAMTWYKDGVEAIAPRHIAFRTWSGYSPFVTWQQIVEEWLDSQGDITKIQAFMNNVLTKTWSIKHKGTITEAIIDDMPLEKDLSKIVAVTAGVDVQDDRIELQYAGFDQENNIYVLGYDEVRGDMDTAEPYIEMGMRIIESRFQCGDNILRPAVACIDTQGHKTKTVHEFLKHNANNKSVRFVGINGVGGADYEISDKASTNRDVKGSVFYSIGTNILKYKIYDAIRKYDQPNGSFRISYDANLPKDYAKQLTAEKMEIRRIKGVDKIVFTNDSQRRNEALDTLVYCLAAKAYIRDHMRDGRRVF